MAPFITHRVTKYNIRMCFFQSTEERFNRVIPVHVPSALTSPTTSPAAPTSLDILYLKCLTFNDLL